ncbi:methyltransferase, TIGR04325 family [Pedobacter cryoconitis]|uniref:Putative methyltransferase (TIGR04325 family) n=1 Tax=Pedobacter cryoconitis TaxID=188932 RepID=A0A7X0J0M2_9SPHI|nr:methyltransferase, TIGR04325 family [Pedobacter cryoconitis]MBB6498853.1 putative methyltransferase (TIGR04325 family) [Pedobacter cryoconitis]
MSFFKSKKKHESNKYGWFGDYKNWDELVALSGGYESNIILDKTRDSLLKIKNGEAVYERDSVLFDKKTYPFSVISSLLYASINCGNSLNVIDFGGSLGSTYYQVKDFLPSSLSVNWSVVEQKEYVTCGQQMFEDEVLKFHHNISESMKSKKADILLLSGVVQYLQEPHDFLNQLKDFDFKYILIDRTSFINDNQPDRLTLQIVPPYIYEAKYPSWFFNEQNFLKHFEDYNIKTEFESYVIGEQNIQIDNQVQGYDKGFLLVRK